MAVAILRFAYLFMYSRLDGLTTPPIATRFIAVAYIDPLFQWPPGVSLPITAQSSTARPDSQYPLQWINLPVFDFDRRRPTERSSRSTRDHALGLVELISSTFTFKVLERPFLDLDSVALLELQTLESAGFLVFGLIADASSMPSTSCIPHTTWACCPPR